MLACYSVNRLHGFEPATLRWLSGECWRLEPSELCGIRWRPLVALHCWLCFLPTYCVPSFIPCTSSIQLILYPLQRCIVCSQIVVLLLLRREHSLWYSMPQHLVNICCDHILFPYLLRSFVQDIAWLLDFGDAKNAKTVFIQQTRLRSSSSGRFEPSF